MSYTFICTVFIFSGTLRTNPLMPARYREEVVDSISFKVPDDAIPETVECEITVIGNSPPRKLVN